MRRKRVGLIGNPNSGKSSLFNALTGLNQKISNYPGVTVDRRSGVLTLHAGQEIELVDFPGIYSLYPNSSEEKIVVDALTQPDGDNYPDAILYVAATLELEKHFLLATQLRELNIPMTVCLTMSDISDQKGVRYDIDQLTDYLGVPVVTVSSLKGINMDGLRYQLLELINRSPSDAPPWKHAYPYSPIEQKVIDAMTGLEGHGVDYQRLLIGHHHTWLRHLTAGQRIDIAARIGETGFNSIKQQIDETLWRYNRFTPTIKKAEIVTSSGHQSLTERIDAVITHRFFGPLIFFAILFFVFQAIFAWSETPMSWIEAAFAGLGSWINAVLPNGWLADLLVEGVIAGLGGIMVFIPQIAILFFLITLLEEVGYMSRAVFMFDSVMQRFGLNGRSMVALVSSGACAIPAIMSTRTIANWKERMITIMVSPLISCSARIPVYAILIGFVVPDESWGWFNKQGLAFMGLYLLGIVAALLSAWVFKLILKNKETSFLMIELPTYKEPRLWNVLITVREKVTTFIWEAGKVILVISIVLWFLASYGPNDQMQRAISDPIPTSISIEGEKAISNYVSSRELEASYAGHIGKLMEPAIAPLGFDWKIGIALLTSFAAREVFVGTMATIYSVGNTDDELTIRERLAAEINPDTGGPRFDMATSLSLLIFYVFALQCMSTLAITRRETKSWKWPAIQFTFMGVLAYLSSMAVYQAFG